jgi:tetratricopeptide (TPR) repeat protein
LEKVMKHITRTFLVGFTLAAGAIGLAQSPVSADYRERIVELEHAVRANPSDVDALEALAGSYAMGNRYGEAIAVVQKLVVLKRGDPSVMLHLAKLYSWNGQNERSLEVLKDASLLHSTQATAFRCDVLNAIPRAAEAAACFDGLAKLATADHSLLERALLGRARNQMWSGNRKAAERSYKEYVAANPSDITAALEYIELLRVVGDYGKAEKLCDRILRTDPRNAEVLAKRAEILFWAGNRGHEARRNAAQSVDAGPQLTAPHIADIAALESLGLNDAASQQVKSLPDESSNNDMVRFLEDRLHELSTARLDLPVSIYNDSDGIHDSVYQVSTDIPVRGDHSVQMNVAQYNSSAPTGIFTAGRDRAFAREFTVGGTGLLAPGLHLSAAGGGSARSGDGNLRPTFNAVLSGSPWDRWNVSFGSSREFLKVTPRAIDQGVSSLDAFADLRHWFNSKTSLGVRIDRRWWSDQNRSIQGDATFTRNFIYHRGFNLDAGALSSHQTFARDMLAVSGFFTPDRYSRYDGFLNTHGEIKRWLTWELRGEGGTQQIVSTAAYLPNWAVTSRLSIKFSRSVSLYGSYERKNYTLLARNGWYQGFYVSLRIQP